MDPSKSRVAAGDAEPGTPSPARRPRPRTADGVAARQDPRPTIAEVAFNLPLDKSFHYLIPEAMRQTLAPGMRVAAPFGPRERIGFVLKVVAESPVKELKEIRRVLDPRPVIGEEQWALASWLSTYYCCSMGEALATMVPGGLRLRAGAGPAASGTPPAVLVPDGTAAGGGGLPSASPVPTGVVMLTAHQRQALPPILEALEAKRFASILLFGVTGSGKTELYLQAIDRALRQGRSAICLIPEIALTPQTTDRFVERFGGGVAVWHSRMSARARSRDWMRMSDGACRIVVGARSAVFAPVQRLGLIIIDEEHEPTYKQEDAPRYHAREVAMARARLAGAAVVLGSATPSVESYYAAARRAGGVVTLPERIAGRGLPAAEVIDMREEMSSRRRFGPLSARLERALAQTVERGEQAMLLLNRRGFARVAQCKTCGAVERCARCSVPLVYHAGRRELVCHYCNFHEPPRELCRQCRKGYLSFRGSGTERVESELHRLFPVASIARMDRDTTARRGSHRELYEAVKTRQVNLLVGTQMIAKGFDFPQVTLVGVVSADTALNLPDFRAGERTFDLLTQMAGRAGRGERPGRVLIQTFCPGHYAIQAAKAHDYLGFYAQEIRMRRALRLPPFVHLIELTVLGSSLPRVEEAAQWLAGRLRRALARRLPAAPGKGATRAAQAGAVLLGPAPHRIPRLRRAYRVHLLLKARSVEAVTPIVRRVLAPGRKAKGLPVIVNVDPL
ncbi:MAG: primosomal protein N' [Candidatus Omnitrophica bacterium]|nr:primosomal protein N' [Candidatus Omnitrophota bacterium]